MNRFEYVNIINDAVLNDDSKQVISVLNELFASNKYKNYIDIVFMAISSFQLYGFLAYLNNDEQEKFFRCDFFRTASYRGKTLPFYNNGQESLFFEFEKHKKIFLSAPTSFGKTSIISEYIIINKHFLKNIIFIVPTNSLLEELFQKFSYFNKKLDLDYMISTQVRFYKDKRNLLFLTPERFLLLAETINLSEFDLIVMDEAYKIVESKNQTVSDFVNNRAVRFRKVTEILGSLDIKVIFLSPFTYQETNSMKKFFEKYNIYKINRELEYVDREVVNIENSNQFKEYFNIQGFTGYQKKLNTPEKVSKILERLENEKNIVYISNYASGYHIIEVLEQRSIDTKNINFKRYLTFIKHLNDNYCLNGMPKWKIVEALEKGYGLYISPMPRFIKKEIIKLYNNDILGSLLVTTSFTEGVNTNAKNLIFTSLVNGPTINKLADIDVLNVAGRAGRFAKSSLGKVICINSDVYNTVKTLQDASYVKLNNYNYIKQSNHIDYEIDMMEDEYLTTEDKLKKEAIKQEMIELGLTNKDLQISLNVSNKWKLVLYKSFLKQEKEMIERIADALHKLTSEEYTERSQSIGKILTYINIVLSKADINPFPMEDYEIQAFALSGKCNWSRLYNIYCQGSSKQIIETNMKYVVMEFNKILPDSRNKKKSQVKSLFFDNKKLWLLKYYDENLSINYNAFYSETFKFISNVIQYKIPFYLSYFISVFNLFIKKSKYHINYAEIDVSKVTMSYENGIINESYNEMVDYGLSNDLILKLASRNIDKNKLINNQYNRDDFDEYENIVIDEYKEFSK